MNVNKVRRKRVFWWSAFGLWLMLTVYLSSQNGSGSSDVSSHLATWLWRASNFLTRRLLDRGITFVTFHLYVRKLAHFLVHFVLAFVTVRASVWSFPRRKDAIVFSIIFAICLAIFDELIQLFAPGRFSAIFDGGINLAGVTLGILISSRFGPNRARNTSS